jgi:hypothetical protein
VVGVTSIAVLRPIEDVYVVLDLDYDVVTDEFTLSATVWLGDLAIRLSVARELE